MTVDDLATLRDIGSLVDGHPNPSLGFPFFDAATGSLGQGLSVAAGLGCAARLDRIDKRIFCLIGDGEAREGQIWEAMDFIGDQRLANVVAIFNCNGLGQSDYVSPLEDWEHLRNKVEAFGWKARVIDGHDPGEIDAALSDVHDNRMRPLAILARTVKGWGVPELQGPGHHGTAVKPDRLGSALAALDARAAQLGAAGIARDTVMDMLGIAMPPDIRQPSRKAAAAAESTQMAEQLIDAIASRKAMSPRRAYGLALGAIASVEPRIVALDGDVKNSTYVDQFAAEFPDRYFEGRIAEQNMVSVAAGLAAAGKIAFVSTFGRFMQRAFDQVEMALIGGLPIKLVGSHVGVTLAADGPSQMALADIGFMRALAHVRDRAGRPAMTVLTPSDAVSAYALTLAAARHPGACYLRLVRADLPVLYTADEKFPLGGARIVGGVMTDAANVILVASGYMVHSCLAAAARLADRGRKATVVDAYSLPFDAAAILDLARSVRAPLLTVEDNYAGGIGSDLAEAAAGSPGSTAVRSLVVHKVPKSGRSADDVLNYVRLSVAEIVAAAESLVSLRHAAE